MPYIILFINCGKIPEEYITKKFRNIAAILIVLMLTFSVFASAVSASEVSEGDTPNLISAPASSPATILAELENVKLDRFGVEISVPKYETMVTADSPEADIFSAMGLGAEALLENGYLVYAMSSDTNNIIYVTYDVNDYTKSLGSYASLSDDDREAVLEMKAKEASATADDATFETINGVGFARVATVKDETNDNGDTVTMSSEVLTTVYNGVEYQIGMRFAGVDLPEEENMIKAIRNSIKITKGDLGYAFAAPKNAGMTTAEKVLSVISGLLAVAVGYLFYKRKKD